mmetsp:Transcript_7296/g.17789  ORF Transcript_7296/g.17789 Transcript_7296/m.17789 type:complete len:422 (+) Transcript_7296:124-1389(+)
MSVADRANKRMKGDGGSIGGGPPPPDGYYGQHPPSTGRYPPYGGPGGPPMGSGYSMWQQGHPPPHSWGRGSSGPPPPHGSMYQQRGGPPMGQDRSNYGGSYSRGHPPPMSGPPGPGGVRRGGKPPGPGGLHRGGKPPGPPASSRPTSKGSGPDGPPAGVPPTDGNAPPPQSGYQGGYYPPHQTPYGNSPYSSGPPAPMHHAPPQSYNNAPPQQNNMYGNSPARPSQSRPRSSPEILGGGTYGQSTSTGTDAPDFDNLFSPRAAGQATVDDDGNSSVNTGGGGPNSKEKGRGSYKCGRCGVPKKGHVCPYQPKLTRKVGEPLPEMRSAAIQVEMDEFMTLRRLNLKIQGFPESYASEPQGEDMVVGEAHQHSSINRMSPLPPQQQQHGDVMNADNGNSPSIPSSAHDQVSGALTEDLIVGAA